MKDQDSRLLELMEEAITSETMDAEAIIDILKQGRRRVKRFDTIVKQADRQLIEQVYQQEKEFNLRMQNERMLAQQAKHAALGEMMDAVAHQWKQPLSELGSINNYLMAKLELNKEITKDEYNEVLNNNLHYMSVLELLTAL